MDLSTIAPSIVIGLMTAIITAAAAYLGAKHGRTAGYRTALYNKQLEACREVSEAISGYTLTPVELEEYRLKIQAARCKWSVYLTVQTVDDLQALENSIVNLIAFYIELPSDTFENNLDKAVALELMPRLSEVRLNWLKTTNGLRSIVGMEAIKGETSPMIGKSSTEELEIYKRSVEGFKSGNYKIYLDSIEQKEQLTDS